MATDATAKAPDKASGEATGKCATKVSHDAAARVFNTYELVERILIEVEDSNSTVLLAQRINKMCEHVVNRSNSLQIKLFFRPATVKRYQAVQPANRNTEFENKSGYAINPLLTDRYSRPDEIGEDLIEEGGEYGETIRLRAADYGAFLAAPSGYSRVKDWRKARAHKFRSRYPYASYRHDQDEDIEESWERMLLVHCKENAEPLDVYPRPSMYYGFDEDWEEFCRLYEKEDFDVKSTMGDLWPEWKTALRQWLEYVEGDGPARWAGESDNESEDNESSTDDDKESDVDEEE